MRIAVILSTYNNPEWLEKSLWGFACQEHKDFEILIADDGSTIATVQCIEDMRRQTGLTLHHIWQAKDGFQKSRILNKAIVAAQSDYLLFSDGDCIPRRDFVAMHVRYAQAGYFLSGGYYKLPLAISQAITPEDITSGSIFSFSWLVAHGLRNSPKVLKLALPHSVAMVLNQVTTTKPTLKGSNSSAWKNDILQINGFDERMQYGGQDRELGERLVNAGIKARQIRYSTTCLHLDHARGYKTQESLEHNLSIRQQTRTTKAVWTPYGINKTNQLDEPVVDNTCPALITRNE